MGRKTTNRPIKPTYAVIGDGQTEFIYIESIKTEFKTQLEGYTVKPELPKHSNVAELGRLIEKSLNQDHSDKVFCIVDMDTKLSNEQEMAQYKKLKQKYAKNENVAFYETHPCTELWFYYHFKPTTTCLEGYEPHTKELIRKKIANYEKKAPFCTHQHICKCGGSLSSAKKNAEDSIKSRDREDRQYTYSEMASFFEDIGLKNE